MLDLVLPDMDGRAIVRTLHERWSDLRIIVLTAQWSRGLPAEPLAVGVSGFVHKSSSLEEMETAVGRVLSGGVFFSTGSQPAPTHHRQRPLAGPVPGTLTEREREIARLVAGGLISKEIAVRLHLSPRTVEKSRAQILAKLGLRDLTGLVRWCMHHGLA